MKAILALIAVLGAWAYSATSNAAVMYMRFEGSIYPWYEDGAWPLPPTQLGFTANQKVILAAACRGRLRVPRDSPLLKQDLVVKR